eukprot:3196472-Amphidinium_carterae.1
MDVSQMRSHGLVSDLADDRMCAFPMCVRACIRACALVCANTASPHAGKEQHPSGTDAEAALRVRLVPHRRSKVQNKFKDIPTSAPKQKFLFPSGTIDLDLKTMCAARTSMVFVA